MVVMSYTMDIQDAIRRIVREELEGQRKELEGLKKSLKRNLERVAEILGARYEPDFSDLEEEDDRPRCTLCHQPLKQDAPYYNDNICSNICMARAMILGQCMFCVLCNRPHGTDGVARCAFSKRTE